MSVERGEKKCLKLIRKYQRLLISIANEGKRKLLISKFRIVWTELISSACSDWAEGTSEIFMFELP